MDPLIAKALVETKQPQTSSGRPPKSEGRPRTAQARVRAAKSLRQLADRLEPRSPAPAGC